ncbi:MAG TPA: DUF885 domain-containing protein, partial [Thermoanaerobaculia bacterium]|nr:DUF885 domain-containing protein [Thermoanaerobaculia bacterium]
MNDPSNAAAGFRSLLEDEWEWRLREFPTYATYVGDRRYNDRLERMTLADIERRKKERRALLDRATAIDRAALPESERLNYDLILGELQLEMAGHRFPSELLPVNQMSGVHQELAELALFAPRSKREDFENFIGRIRDFPRVIGETIELLREGAARGIVPPKEPLRQVPDVIAAQIAEDPETTPVWRAMFAELPQGIGDPEPLRNDARAALKEVAPALRRLLAFWNDEYYPRTRSSIALSDLPDGRAWYAYKVREMTTTELDPDEIHEIGEREVARIEREMESIRKEVAFEGTLEEFFDHLRSDAKFFFREKNELLVAYRDIAKRLDPELPRLFRTLPRLPYGVAAVPEYSEKTQPTAYYMPGSPEAGRPGIFYANTYDLRARPRWEMEALTAHEAVPGHHLQIALAQEMEDVPPFRKWASYTAFIEGWGLYSESLGGELGLYRDPYSRFGRLTYEMWRAIRLVVDTGIHSKGWSRAQALDYFRAHAGKADHDISVEVDRYIVWPAQALAYKIGQLKITELREGAQRKLGDAFDIRAFHDVVLQAGPVPL